MLNHYVDQQLERLSARQISIILIKNIILHQYKIHLFKKRIIIKLNKILNQFTQNSKLFNNNNNNYNNNYNNNNNYYYYNNNSNRFLIFQILKLRMLKELQATIKVETLILD